VKSVTDTVREELRRVLAALPASEPASSAPLTVKQAATRLNVEPATVRGYIDDGLLLATKPRKRWLVRPEDLEAFIAKRGEASKGSGDQLGRILKRVQGL
jgi:excisionase family DNA binding protein